jgi:hypothetical protein
MSPGAAAGEREGGGIIRGPLAIATAFEVVLIFAGILAYIWRWQHANPLAWMGHPSSPLIARFMDTNPLAWGGLFALILVSHALHHDTLRGLGLGWTGMRAGAQWVLPLAILLYLPLLFYGFAHHRLALLHPTWQSLVSLLGYGAWCAFQQYLTQSYFNNRLMLIIRNRHASSALIGIMFSATHLPNLILMVATLVAGFIFAEVFAHHRNIWPLALVQAVGGLLLAAVAPDALIHHMRVGPGYFFYGIR